MPHSPSALLDTTVHSRPQTRAQSHANHVSAQYMDVEDEVQATDDNGMDVDEEQLPPPYA